jgi:nucleoid-associated protein YgaU
MDRQERQARYHDFSYLRDAAQVKRFVSGGYLVPVRGNSNYRLKGVSFPYARPEARLFIERLSNQYRNACGEQLVVTSLTRTLDRQPRNASTRSVHPTGMAVDLRRSNSSACRNWLERVLLSLEEQGVLEATRERRPPHYHIAIFPKTYSSYVTQLAQRTPEQKARAAQNSVVAYEVRRGDSLWTIARKHGTTVDQLKAINSMRGSSIYAGQTLQVPVTR